MLKECVYCQGLVSPKAAFCPHCKHPRPLDAKLKQAEHEARQARLAEKERLEKEHDEEKKLKNEVLTGTISCKACNQQLRIGDVLSGRPCPNCGHPNSISCDSCHGIARCYDPKIRKFVCASGNCDKCHRHIVCREVKTEVVEQRYPCTGGRIEKFVFCKSCHRAYRKSRGLTPDFGAADIPGLIGCLLILGLVVLILFGLMR